MLYISRHAGHAVYTAAICARKLSQLFLRRDPRPVSSAMTLTKNALVKAEPEDGDANATTTVTCYGYACPLASQCKKGSKVTKTCYSEEEARWNVTQHLLKSPYHELSEQEAQEALQTVDVQTWEAEKKHAEKTVAKEEQLAPQ